MDDPELPLFDFNTITMATNNFFEVNKLHKEVSAMSIWLVDGQEIVLKRLSKTSRMWNMDDDIQIAHDCFCKDIYSIKGRFFHEMEYDVYFEC
ncbi:hypothetical protein VNO77_22619 [Canavalia gladiata]|uniref:Uncharacterized protein n=1 Tax=Canavalia gladiata TaxID=3824 RepID=A0AAN9L2X4_CANGL